MPHKVRIALDAMGGDHGAAVVVPGAELSLSRHPDIEFFLFGDRAAVDPLLDARPQLKAASHLVHTDVVVQMHDKPSQALAKIDLRTMAGINRPAIAALWPTLKGESVVLDLGASIGADAEHLVELAAMGSAMAGVLFGLDRPTVGLLNIGVEEVKGLEAVREAGQMLRAGEWPQFEYVGFVEGDDIGKGTVDVVVTEGFSGNIALKTAEGTARQLGRYLKHEMNRTLVRRLGYLLARGAFRALGNKMDPRKSNGGVFLGLNGIVIKSHGGTDAEGFAYAVDLGYDMVRHELLAKIGHSLTRHHGEVIPARAVGGAAS